MKKKILLKTLLVIALVAIAFFAAYSIFRNEAAKRAAFAPAFEPQEIDVDILETDIDFARAIPEYNILFSGLLGDPKERSFLEFLIEWEEEIETITAKGIRSDGETVEASFTGIKMEKILESLDILQESKNVIVYATDLYAADFTMEEIKEKAYLVYKRDGMFFNPTEDGFLKIVADGLPTTKWIKNPTLFDFIADFEDVVIASERLEPESIDFLTEQQMFKLSLGIIPDIDIENYTLEIGGLVENPMVLTYEDLLGMPQKSVYATLETISNPKGGPLIGNAIWTGVLLSDLMDAAGIKEEAIKIVFYCADQYSTAVTIEEASGADVILAYKMNGRPLAPDHGYPFRVVLPEKYGMKWAKWVNGIALVDYDYKGFWEQQGWSDYAGRDRPEQRFD
jgi:DMSO/TMAO reductase YedYZ molybdopterin-dependent catalytic subunit